MDSPHLVLALTEDSYLNNGYSDGYIHHPFYICESKIACDWVGRHIHPAEVGRWAHGEEGSPYAPWTLTDSSCEAVLGCWACALPCVVTHFGNTYCILTGWLWVTFFPPGLLRNNWHMLLYKLESPFTWFTKKGFWSLITYVIICFCGVCWKKLHLVLLHNVDQQKVDHAEY